MDEEDKKIIEILKETASFIKYDIEDYIPAYEKLTQEEIDNINLFFGKKFLHDNKT